MTITFQNEKLADVLREPGARELVLDHFMEVAEDQSELPVNIDWPRFLAQEEGGRLLLRTARDGRQIVGYMVIFLEADPSTGTNGAWDGPWFLDPEYREGMTGYKLLFGGDDDLKARGVRRIIHHQKWAQFVAGGGALFQRAGYRPFEVRWSRLI